MHRWNGCVALVTGASRGVGAAISKKLVDHGVNVVGCTESLQDGQTKDLVSSRGIFHLMKCDITKENEVLAMFDEIKRKYNRIDICINNAGIFEYSPITTGKLDDWRSMMEVNVLGMCLCTRETLKLMKETKIDDGLIIQTCSIGGHKFVRVPKGTPELGISFYNGTKFMVRALAEGLRQELKSHDSRIRVAMISPASVRSNMLEKAMKSAGFSYEKDVRYLNPEDIADAILFILQSKAHVNIDDVIVQAFDYRV